MLRVIDGRDVVPASLNVYPGGGYGVVIGVPPGGSQEDKRDLIIGGHLQAEGTILNTGILPAAE